MICGIVLNHRLDWAITGFAVDDWRIIRIINNIFSRLLNDRISASSLNWALVNSAQLEKRYPPLSWIVDCCSCYTEWTSPLSTSYESISRHTSRIMQKHFGLGPNLDTLELFVFLITASTDSAAAVFSVVSLLRWLAFIYLVADYLILRGKQLLSFLSLSHGK